MSLLKLAVDAHLPLVAVRTRDVINLPVVLAHILGREVRNQLDAKKGGICYQIIPPGQKPTDDWGKRYEQMTKAEATMLVVNPPFIDPAMFDAGEVPVPKDLMFHRLLGITGNEQKTMALMAALGGTTIKEGTELLMLTMGRDKSLTPHGLMETRRMSFQPQNGLTLVDSHQDLYVADDRLFRWIEKEKKFFLDPKTDHRLVPRGLLFDGPPGVGKTAGSKFIAERFGVPLYHVDMGGTKDKWMGQSERNNLANLQRLDSESPCIALFDEVEKVFSMQHGHGDSGTTTTMLSQLLWWFAERRSRVLTILTTNDIKKLPPELFREGRIDRTFRFEGLDFDSAVNFTQDVLGTFEDQMDPLAPELIVEAAMKGVPPNPLPGTPKRVSQASLTQHAYEYVKQLRLSKGVR